MELPVKEMLSVQVLEVKGIETTVTEWADENRDKLHKLSLEGCFELLKYPEIYSIPILEFVCISPFDNEEELIAELEIDRDGALNTLDICQEWFVETEDYRSAARVVECREILSKQINK
jgi:hypothetical protein